MKDVRVKAGVKVGDLVRFKGYDDVLGVLVGALGIVLDTEGKSTVRVRWLTGLLSGQTTSTLPWQLEKIASSP